MIDPMSLYGAVELGGTKTLVTIGTSPRDMSEPRRIPTTGPSETLASVVEYLEGHSIDAVGVASFGPVEIRPDSRDYGSITSTPKPGWSNVSVLGAIQDAFDVPIGFDTDVNGAALGEGRWGAASGLSNYAYVTVGTGIGVGIVVAGETLKGLGHPEGGHVPVVRHPDDRYPGRCPFHAECLEGMAGGPALVDRFGPHESWQDLSGIADLAVHYLSQGLRALVYTVVPERIVVGGGVSKLPDFHGKLQAALDEQLGGYPDIPERGRSGFVSPPGLGDDSGLAGGLILAETALS